jgi:hypothetical protein
MGARRYTEREDRFIRDHYIFMTDEELSSKMRRTAVAIAHYRQSKALYKEGENAFNQLNNEICLANEIFALKYYISLGKGGDIAIERLNYLLAKRKPKYRPVRPKKRITPLRILAKIYSLSTTGMSCVSIEKETGYHNASVYRWIKEIKGVKSGLTITLPSKV